MQFSTIPGLKELKKGLITSFQRNHIAHAQLFSGREGEGALAMALAFATYLLCENKEAQDSCGTCGNCQRMAKFIHPDVHFFYPSPSSDKDEVRANYANLWREFLINNPYGILSEWITKIQTENKQNQIGKADALNIIKSVSMKSFEGGYKIVVIWCPELMHISAANAILKVLEEPPENTIYFMVTHDYEGLISTILSRTQLLIVPSFSDDDIAQYISGHEGVEGARAHKVSKLAKGNMKEALLLSRNEDEVAFQGFQMWMRACFKPDYEQLIQLSEDFARSSKSIQRTSLAFALDLIRNALVGKGGLSLNFLEGHEKEFVQKFSQTFEFDIFEKLYIEFNETLTFLGRNANSRMTHLALSLRLVEIFRKR